MTEYTTSMKRISISITTITTTIIITTGNDAG
ncbi:MULTISPECIES: thr operon leader peptide [Enterobacter]|nr:MULTISPECIES: thr operon leader peptide [Enterobacter]MCK7291088.1 thr operon leader peptide [Enterobacter bugandensis]MDX7621087.1 thr operon leader peptide [Enterobacter bugandensis]